MPDRLVSSDYKHRVMYRCPACEAWDRNLEGLDGEFDCEECAVRFRMFEATPEELAELAKETK